MKLEERIRRAVEFEIAGRPADQASWETLQGRARVARRRRVALAVLAAASLGLSAGIAITELGDRGDRPSPGPFVTEPAVSPGQAADIPDTIVALDHGNFGVEGDERIVVIETSTGRLLRVLAKGTTGAEPISFGPSLALTPDGRTVYFEQLTSGSHCAAGRIMTVPLTGGTPRLVVEGTAVAISPNGRMLAYVAMGQTKPDCTRPDLVVRDLNSGRERRWRWAAEDPNDPYQQRGAQKLAWAPNGRHLAFERNVGDPMEQVWVLDTTRGTTLLDAINVTPDRKVWSSPTYIAAGLAVIEGIRSIHDPEGVSGRIILVDPSDGRVLRQLWGEVDGLVNIDAEVRGEHVVLATTEGLFRVGEEGVVRVATGSYYSAVW
jgi:hypothetical protein